MDKLYYMSDLFDLIKEIASDGIITTGQIEKAGISRIYIKALVEEGRLIKEAKGVYSISGEYPDEYKILQVRSQKMVFSFGTALYLWGMSDRVPHRIDVTVPQGYNVSRIKKDNPKIRFHYAQPEKWNTGITETKTPMGSNIKLYDKERCICDLILMKDEVDKQLYIHAVKEYFNKNCNARRLLAYARLFRIEERVRDYMEILI
ncbi:MAG: type IV toxin-antitoxin system AbiEi family antitoxin domain-containing protein [Lachnospira eligens]